MRTVRLGPIGGLTGQVALLAALATFVGLGLAGWLAGLGFGFVMAIVLTRGLNRAGTGAFGPANAVTLTRATLVGAVAALTADALILDAFAPTAPAASLSAPATTLVALASVALVLDLVDGKVARRTGTASALGARFDMEIDAFLILTLSVYVAPSVGAWVLAIGLMRYAYVAASWGLVWLRGAPPPRYWCKVVAAIQGIVLTIAAADVLPTPLMVTAVLMALGLLIESFGRDVWWLWQHRPAPDSRPPLPATELAPGR